MSLNQEEKQQIIKSFAKTENDTGSPAVQIAVLSKRIALLSEHMKTHAKDFHSRRGLMKMVATRRKLLDYVKRTNPAEYADLLKRLELRK